MDDGPEEQWRSTVVVVRVDSRVKKGDIVMILSEEPTSVSRHTDYFSRHPFIHLKHKIDFIGRKINMFQ